MEVTEKEILSRNVPGIYDKLKKAKVGIAGLGGLGSNIAVSLARSGVGDLLLVDFDYVEASNLNRQYYFLRHIGMKKTEALTEIIKEINPFVNVETRQVKINETNAPELFADCDILCEAFDDPAAKAMLVSSIIVELPGIKVIASSGMAGLGASNDIRSLRRMERLYICGDFKSSMEEGMIASRVMLCAAHQAHTVLRLLTGFDEV